MVRLTTPTNVKHKKARNLADFSLGIAKVCVKRNWKKGAMKGEQKFLLLLVLLSARVQFVHLHSITEGSTTEGNRMSTTEESQTEESTTKETATEGVEGSATKEGATEESLEEGT